MTQSLPPNLPETIGFFRRNDNKRARHCESELRGWLKKHAPHIKVIRNHPEVLVVLGGDGTLLEAARHADERTVLLGLNLGTVGFLASVRRERDFRKALTAVIAGRYRRVDRLMISFTILRKNTSIVSATALNEIYILNPLGMVTIDVGINKSRIQRIQGTGALVATPTGSTGYNLSAHGPIVDPALRCLIITEILDHNFPTPSIVVPAHAGITLTVTDFRQRTTADVVLLADGQPVCTLAKNDRILIQSAQRVVGIVELEQNYFYRSLHEKFSFS